MKNLTKLLVLALAAGLTACASDEEATGRNYRYVGNQENNCGEALIEKKPTPAPMPVRQVAYQPAPVARPCGGCQPTEYTVRTPVKVVYKNTTYHTVYEPRTYETTSFETRPFNRGEACATGNCIQENTAVVSGQPVVTRQPVLQQPAVSAPETVEVYEK